MKVDLSIAQSVGEIVLNRPDKLNALNEAMARMLNERLEEAERAGVRALVMRGEGRGFCAGRDLGDADPFNEDAQAILEGIFNPVIKRLAHFPAPSFAAVHGACLGVGLGLALACDVVLVAEDARLGSPFARIGAVLDSGGHWFFVERLGGHRALEIIYTGRMLGGREAEAWDLVNRCVENSKLLEQVRAMAAAAASGPTAAFLESKRLVRRIEEEGLGFTRVLSCEAAAQGAASKTADYREGIGAFQQKRAPQFSGR